MLKPQGEFFYHADDHVVRWENSYIAYVTNHAEGIALVNALNAAIHFKPSGARALLDQANVLLNSSSPKWHAANVGEALLLVLRYLRQ